ncbi:undecaprenyl-diphosphate phosphatase [Buchnera aphidicola]|nr:undecaprenyl-diphosphate phosphatase [Buchnera aphidicola]
MTTNIFNAIILGIVEGITEFFPISSSGHLLIFTNILEMKNNEIKILNTIIQTGAALSILLHFKEKFVIFLEQIFICKQITKKNDLIYHHIILGNIPIIFIGLCIYQYIKYLSNFYSIIYALIFGTILLILTEISKTKISSNKNIETPQILIIGIFQCLALWPGFSRSCATISAGILSGLKQSKSVEFSFILSVPIFFGASVLDVINNFYDISINNIPMLFSGFLSAFITSNIVIKRCLNTMKNCSLIPFIIYRSILSIIIYLFFMH